MPKEFTDCVAALTAEKGKDSAYAICVAQYTKKHGKSPFKSEAEIAELPEISARTCRLLEAQLKAEQEGKTVKIIEEVTGGPVPIAETKA